MMQSFYVTCMLDELHPSYQNGAEAAELVNLVAMEEGGVRSHTAMEELIRQCVRSEDIETFMLRPAESVAKDPWP